MFLIFQCQWLFTLTTIRFVFRHYWKKKKKTIYHIRRPFDSHSWLSRIWSLFSCHLKNEKLSIVILATVEFYNPNITKVILHITKLNALFTCFEPFYVKMQFHIFVPITFLAQEKFEACERGVWILKSKTCSEDFCYV